MANRVPRFSTWTFTPISNMSAAGAIATSACCAWASICRTASDVPASTHDWFTEPVTRYDAPIARAAAGRPGRRDPPRRPDPERPIVAVLGLHPIAERQHRRQQDDRGLVVGMPAGIGLGGDVLGHRDPRGPLGLLGRDVAGRHQFPQEPLRRRCHELRRDLDPRHLGDDPVRRLDPARFLAADPATR